MDLCSSTENVTFSANILKSNHLGAKIKTFLKSHCGHADINQINTYLKIYLFPHIIKEFRQWGVTEINIKHIYIYTEHILLR